MSTGTQALQRIEPLDIRNMDDVDRIAQMFADSGYFTDARDVAQAGVKILAGRELGFGPFASMNGIHIIHGKPAMGAHLMASAIRASGRYDFRVRHLDDKQARIEFFMGDETLGMSTFTLEDAKRAGTQNIGKFPRNMLYARAMSNGAKWYTPDVYAGVAVYTPDEIREALAAEADDIIDVEVASASTSERASATDRLANKLRGKGKPAPEPAEEAAETAAEALEDEFPPDPPPGMFGEDVDANAAASGDDDAATDEPDETPEPERGMTAAQAKALMKGLTDAGFKADDDGKAQGRRYMGWILKRPVAGAADLTRSDAETVLAEMGAYRQNSYEVDRNTVEQSVAEWVAHEAQASEGDA